MEKNPKILKEKILELTKEYSELVHTDFLQGDDSKKTTSSSVIPYAGRVFDGEEVTAAVESCLDFWLTLGPQGHRFESEFSNLIGCKKSLLVNSGSSANLLAISSLTSYKIVESKRLKVGDEVITCAAGFPTTVAPILQNRLVPVFVDNDPVTGNFRSGALDAAFSPGKTKAVFFAHTLGNPFNLLEALTFCRKHDLWLIEDNCDALGCSYSMPLEKASILGLEHLIRTAKSSSNERIFISIDDNGEKCLNAPTGVWGDISTQSFYPPHHLTMGEGGAVNIVHDKKMVRIVESFRDWGRDCYCPSGKDNTCLKRFGWSLGDLPHGYDHKYVYSHIGYNLKPLDVQAAIGLAQLRKLQNFIDLRKKNWEYLRKALEKHSEYIEFTLPTHAISWNDGSFVWDKSGCGCSCSWFGFMIRIKGVRGMSNTGLARFLDDRGVGNRMLFGGNLVKQPAFVELLKREPNAYRVVGSLEGADDIMNSAIFLGTYPGLTESMLDEIVEAVDCYIEKF